LGAWEIKVADCDADSPLCSRAHQRTGLRRKAAGDAPGLVGGAAGGRHLRGEHAGDA